MIMDHVFTLVRDKPKLIHKESRSWLYSITAYLPWLQIGV